MLSVCFLGINQKVLICCCVWEIIRLGFVFFNFGIYRISIKAQFWKYRILSSGGCLALSADMYSSMILCSIVVIPAKYFNVFICLHLYPGGKLQAFCSYPVALSRNALKNEE